MKTLKRIALLCLLVLATVCVSLFAACGDDDKGSTDTVTYTVTVTDDSDTPLKDITVTYSSGSAFFNKKTDADGKATLDLAPATYTVTLTGLPDGYSAPENITVTKDNPAATAKLSKDFRYVVKLVDENGNPFYRSGVQLAICEIDGNCHLGSLLGEGGIWTTKDVPGDYKIQIQFADELEGQYAFEGSAQGNYYTGEHFSATKTEITIVITSANAAKAYTVSVANPDGTPAKNVYVNLATATSSLTPVQTDADGKAKITVPSYGVYSVAVTAPDGLIYDSGIKTTASDLNITVQLYNLNNLTFGTEMTAAEIAAVGLNANAFDAHFSFTEVFTANETRYFAFNAYKTGTYAIYCKSNNAVFKLCTEGTNFTDAEEYPVGTSMANGIACTNGKTVYFSVKSSAAGNLQFVVAGPDKSNFSTEVTIRNEGTQSITVASADKYATVIFAPAVTGIYEITSLGDFDTKIECYAGNGLKYDEDDNGGDGNNFKYSIRIEQVSAPIVTFRIFVKGNATFPATFNIKVTKTGEIEIIKDPDEEIVEAKQIGSAVYDGTGAFTAVDLSTAQTAVLGDDGYYHLGTIDGPVLVAKLAKAFRNFGIFTTENPNAGGRAATPYYVHFRTYDENHNTTGVYNYISFLEAYKDKCNNDGVYPVNAEIKLMLERWAAYSIDQYTFGIETLGTIVKGNEWLIPCGYYTDGTSAPNPEDDVITGRYTNGNADEEYILTVDIDGSYVITSEGGMLGTTEVESGTWIKNSENNYTFTIAFFDDTYTVTRDAQGALTFIEDAGDPAADPVYVFEVLASEE